MRVKLLALCGALFLLLVTGCGRRPFACFEYEPKEIHVNQPVVFTGFCSSNADDFFWEFYDNEDSTFFGPTITMVFDSPGPVKVLLLVSNESKTAATDETIEVLP